MEKQRWPICVRRFSSRRGRKVGLLGTVAYHIGSTIIPATHTTPGAVEFQGLLAQMVTAGLDTAVMEVSSHALALDRTAGCEFDVAVFTNLTQDHLDFHGTLDEYFRAKQQLFTGLTAQSNKPGSKRAIVNIDDPKGLALCQVIQAPIWTYSLSAPSDIRAEQVQLHLEGDRISCGDSLWFHHDRNATRGGIQCIQSAVCNRGCAP